jgi:hypothetical protein
MEEIKDLGGLVNKDLAFSKLPQDKVYDSVNFRITTDDGNTTAARQNIKGNKYISGISYNGWPCVSSLNFSTSLIQNVFSPGIVYALVMNVNGVNSPVYNLTYSTVATLISDITNLITSDPFFTPFNFSAVAGSNNIIIQSLNCDSIGITSFTTAGPALSSYPYSAFDEEFAIETLNGVSYNATAGHPGVPQWSIFEENLGTTFNTSMTTGVRNSSNVIITSIPTVLIASGTGTGTNATDVYWYADPFYLNNIQTSAPSLFQYFTGGPYQIDFAFYIAKSQNADVNIRIYLDIGDLIDPAAAASFGVTLETIPSIGYPVIVIDSFTYGAAVGATDLNRLDPAYGGTPYTLNYTFPGGLTNLTQLLSPGASFIYNGFIIRSTSQKNAPFPGPPFTYSATTYFDYFRIKGPTLNFSSFINSQTISTPLNFGYIIGWVTLRDDIYLFTTDAVYDPDDPTTWGGPTIPVSSGQIWKFTYDKAGDYADPATYNISLVYNNLLNFTTSRPIANPGMIESRYESPEIQKIYWTDNYNNPRVINVVDPNIGSLLPVDLNLQPSLSMDLPVITEVLDGGELLVGVYQVAYRLKNTNGAESRFSRTSQLIPIIDAAESTASVTTYFPTVPVKDVANKSIRVIVDNVDTTYNTIEFALIYYFDGTSEPEINIVKETFIPASGSVDIVITGAEDFIPITLNELTAFSTYITRAKTLAAKKQTLFLGNIKIGSQEVDWDSRAYRFPRNQNITYVEDTQGAFTPITYVPATNEYEYNFVAGSTVPPTADCIQKYAFQNPDAATSASAYLYQPGTNILGGAGPNVKYEFITENIKLDGKYDIGGNTGNGISVSGPQMLPDSGTVITLNTLDRSFTARSSSLSNSGSPYVYDLILGYKRDEMYRFGIVFYDELDNPTYVNWIADIRTPHIYMPDDAQGDAAGTSSPAFPGVGANRSRLGTNALSTSFSSDPVYYDTANTDLWGRILGIKFTIDFSGVPDKYKKASIVRTPLQDVDRHVVAQGLFLPTFQYDNVVGPVMTAPYTNINTLFTAFGSSGFNAAYAPSGNNIWYDCWTLRSPEFLFKTYPGMLGGDEIDIVNYLDVDGSGQSWLMGQQTATTQDYFACNATGMNYGAGAGNNDFWTAWRTKLYRPAETATRPYSIKNVATSQNPYPVIHSFNFQTGGNDRGYKKGDTILFGSSPQPRSVHGCTPKNIAGTAGGGLNYPQTGFSYSNNSLFVQLNPDRASNWNAIAFGNEYTAAGQDGWVGSFRQYVANYKKSVPAPFGGQGYFARSNSEYIPCNNLIDISVKNVPIQTKVFGGDTTVTVMDYTAQFFDRAEGIKFTSTVNLFLQMFYFPVETSVAVPYRRSFDNSKSIDHESGVTNRVQYLQWEGAITNDAYWSSDAKIESREHFEVDPAFNYTDKSVYRYFPKPALVQVPTVFDCRVWRSEKKIDGELSDSWSVFKPSSFLDVESAYGPLNNLVVFQDKLYFIQDRGFGALQVAEQKLISDQAGDADLVLGSSGILERYDYVSTKTGTKHQFSMSVSDYSMIWFDTLARKIYRYKPGSLEPLTDVKGYSGFIYTRTNGFLQTRDNPYRMIDDPIQGKVWRPHGVHSTYDFQHQEFFMTFLNPDDPSLPNQPDNYITLVYNDLFDGFVGEYTHYPKVYINDKVNIFSPYLDPISPSFDSIFVHNYGDYGRFYNNPFLSYSSISFVVNNNPTLEKTFTNLEVVAEAYSKNNYIGSALNPHQYDSFAAIDYYDFFENMRVFDNYQNTDVIPLGGANPISRRHKTIWNIKVPSDRVLDVTSNIFDPANLDPLRPSITRRMKDKWFVVEMKYNNSPNNRFVVHSAKAIYSANSR